MVVDGEMAFLMTALVFLVDALVGLLRLLIGGDTGLEALDDEDDG